MQMLVECRSLLSGIIRTIDLPVTEEQIEAWENGAKIQEAMPNLTTTQREFILTGIVEAEWDEAFADDEEADEYFSD